MVDVWKYLREHSRDESGTVTIFSILIVILTLLIMGASVDLMRAEATRAEMQTTMDRAVLAATDLDQLQEPEAVVNDYLSKTGIGESLQYVDVEEGANDRMVSAKAKSVQDTIFLRMSGFEHLGIPALSTAEERVTNVEISLVLDISGSMRFNQRMEYAKPAAKNFVNKVMHEDSDGVTTLNVIPFAGHVNPGRELFHYFRGERPTIPEEQEPETPEEEYVDDNEYFYPWAQAISNVVFYFDTDGDGIYDRAHKIEGFPENAPRDADEFYQGAVAFIVQNDPKLSSTTEFLGASIKGGKQTTTYFQVQGDENGDTSDIGPTKNKGKLPGSVYNYSQVDYGYYEQFYTSPNEGTQVAEVEEEPQNVNMPSSCVEIYANEFGTTEMPLSDDYVPHFMMWDIDEETMDWGWCPGEEAAIKYYSDNKADVNAYLDGLRLYDGTGTQHGMKYALALLDPATRDEVSHLIAEGLIADKFAGRPIDWANKSTEKYIVLMSDGGTTPQFRPIDPLAPENGNVSLSTQGSSSYHTMSSDEAAGVHLQKQCDLAKENNVVVFVVAVETSGDAYQQLQDCASSESHFFEVTAPNLWDAFDTVARQINNLRLIQ